MCSLFRPLLVVVTLACCTSCRADETLAVKVDDFVQGEMLTQHIPGLSLLVNKDGQIALARGYGVANVEHQVPVKPETVFQSGSVGKQFTATAVMMLRGHRLIHHGGAWQGFKCCIQRYVDDKLTVIAFANLNGSNLEKIVRGVASIFNSELKPLPEAGAVAGGQPGPQ